MSSIDHVPEQETADAPAEQIAIDGSIGSDTDTGGPLQSEDASKDESDTKHHARSNSVKKPATFKAVSVTKNFLAKAGTPTASAVKINGENGNAILYRSGGQKLTVKLQIQRRLAIPFPQRPDPGSLPRPQVETRYQHPNLRISESNTEHLVQTQCKYGTGTEVRCTVNS